MSTDRFSNKSVLHSIAPFNHERALVRQIPYQIIEDRSAYHILIKIKLRSSSSLCCSLNFEDRQVVLAAKSEKQPMTSETATLVFQVPLDANLNKIRVQSRPNAFLVSIPKNAAHLRIASSHTIYM